MKKFSDNTIKVIAPAKVNLFLAVGAAGSVGCVPADKHPVLNILHTLVLHDNIYLEVVDDGQQNAGTGHQNVSETNKPNVEVEFLQSDDLDVELPDVEPENNLVYKAITQLAKLCGSKAQAQHIRAYVEKNIPTGAGLAGGSSDAAAALIGAAKIFNIDPEDKRVTQVAKTLGADVPFFLNGGCALYTGAGEALDHKMSPINREIILVKPMHLALATAKVYSQFDKLAQTHADLAEITQAAQQLQYADNIPMFNNLAPAAESLASDLAQIRTWLSDIAKPENVLLCGSGACTFAFVPEDDDGEHIAHHAREQG